MSLDLCVLASGSGGNCSVVRSPGGTFLVDCGIGPRVAAARLRGTGVGRSNVSAVCLTHLDRDHFNPVWASTLVRHGIRVFCPADRVGDLLGYAGNQSLTGLVTGFDRRPFEPVPGVTATTVPTAHDRTGSHAFHFRRGTASIGYATDLGTVPAALVDAFCGVDVLALESNYDPDLQRTSGRPTFLQNRITGGSGHLSNQQALTAVLDLFAGCHRQQKSPPTRVVLLHRSRQCNCPDLLRRLFTRDARLRGRIILSEQHERTDWLTAGRPESYIGEQLSLAFG